MTPKEKAEDLFYKMQLDWACDSCHNDWAKECALIAVDLIIECTPSMNIYPPNFQSKNPRVKEYWQEVKQEIEKL